MKAVTDEQLVRWVADGDTSCLATLFERHHRGIYRYFLQILRDRAQSEDLVQDVFLKVLKRSGRFRGDGSFKAWLYRIARNAALDELGRRGRGPQPLPDHDDVRCEPADARSAEQAAAGSQNAALALRALGGLPAPVQEVIWLGRFEFDSYDELGKALDCSAGTARVRMHRAMTQLKAAYARLTGET